MAKLLGIAGASHEQPTHAILNMKDELKNRRNQVIAVEPQPKGSLINCRRQSITSKVVSINAQTKCSI